MFNKLKGYLVQMATSAKTKISGIRQPIKWVVFSYFGMVALLVITYYGVWLWQWKVGEVALGDLLSLIKEMVGTGMVAFVTFIAGCMVDNDHDGVPDQFEKEDEK